MSVPTGSLDGLAAILIDIDQFKRISDGPGHDIGDVAIQAVATAIGEKGLVGRPGGEEFAVMLPVAPSSTPRRSPVNCAVGSVICAVAVPRHRFG